MLLDYINKSMITGYGFAKKYMFRLRYLTKLISKVVFRRCTCTYSAGSNFVNSSNPHALLSEVST